MVNLDSHAYKFLEKQKHDACKDSFHNISNIEELFLRCMSSNLAIILYKQVTYFPLP